MTDEEWRALIRNWVEMLVTAINTGPTIEWKTVTRVLEAMEEISK